ncbi:MAG: hypothetical protein KAR42_15460 [candidate division Zixibacteria bacterium]|nr:hypothetical protein [candidate division Zixibacteria bacterium]
MIESIKKQGDGWLVNGNLSVPNDERNRDCQEVLRYIADGGTVDDEFTQVELDQQSADGRLKALGNTDADMARIIEDIYDYLETSDPAFAAAMPQSVKDKVENRKSLRAAL